MTFNTLLNLPKSLICVIISKLDDTDLHNFLMTSVKCANVCKSDIFWKLKFHRKGHNELFKLKPEKVTFSQWYKMVKYCDLRTILSFAVGVGYMPLIAYIVH